MKICFITLFTPTQENRKGPSALNYYLIRERNENINIKVFSFNVNNISRSEIKKIEKELRVDVEIIPLPYWYRFITSPRHKMTFIRVFLKLPLLTYLKVNKKWANIIKKEKPDLLWWYSSDLFKGTDTLNGFKNLVTGPDCASLTHLRAIQIPSIYNNKLKFIGFYNLLQSAFLMEKNFQTKDTLMHVVGAEDNYLLHKINPQINSFFLLHPHYTLSKTEKKCFNKEKLEILIAGGKSRYNQDSTIDMVHALCKNNKSLKQYYNITFLGKGWNKEVSALVTSGYNCINIEWVDDYIETLIKYDIQITILDAGAGTKGKVLDAIANGLLVIGSEIALENITVRNLESCIIYKKVENIPDILQSIAQNPHKYEIIAQKGKEQVRLYHSPSRISKRFFDILEKFVNNKS